MGFATLDDYQRFTGVRLAADDAEKVDAQLDAACTAIQNELGQTLEYVEDDIIVLPGTGRESLLLPELPVIEVTEIVRDAGLDSEETITDYVVGFGGVLYRRPCWPWGYFNLTVTYTHGYETIPSDLIRVAVAIVRGALDTDGTSGTITSETIGGYSYTRHVTSGSSSSSGLSDFSYVLDRYRLPRIPVA